MFTCFAVVADERRSQTDVRYRWTCEPHGDWCSTSLSTSQVSVTFSNLWHIISKMDSTNSKIPTPQTERHYFQNGNFRSVCTPTFSTYSTKQILNILLLWQICIHPRLDHINITTSVTQNENLSTLKIMRHFSFSVRDMSMYTCLCRQLLPYTYYMVWSGTLCSLVYQSY